MTGPCLRHLLATIAYRFHAAVEACRPEFADFTAGASIRTPRALLAHCIEVLQLARASFEPGLGPIASPDAQADAQWDALVDIFHTELELLDHQLERGAATHSWSLEQLVQGPLADVLTHVGQLAMLRRISGDPVPPQSYLRAKVQVGRLGPDQAPPVPRS